jgi:hypothetical protein
VEHCKLEMDLLPTQIDQFRRPEPVAVGQQDHRGVAVRVPIALGPVDQRFNLVATQIFAGPKLAIGPAPRRHNCSIFDGWRDQLQGRFRQENPPFPNCECLNNAPTIIANAFYLPRHLLPETAEAAPAVPLRRLSRGAD